ncbi:DNA-3-methyladenine glycosylase I [Eionea flava]
MTPFSGIQYQAEQRKGGKAALKNRLPAVPPSSLLLELPDDRFLSMMTKVINQAGFRWSVVEKKWPQFEAAFLGFDIMKLSFLSPEQWENYMTDTRIVRHWQKICAVRENLSFVYDESRKRGGFAQLIGEWPDDDQVGLMLYLKKHGSRLGGQTGPRFLRYVGKDVFMLTGDVVLAMQNAGLDIADNPSSQRDLKKAQTLMNQWREESDLPYTHLSKIAAYSTGINYD